MGTALLVLPNVTRVHASAILVKSFRCENNSEFFFSMVRESNNKIGFRTMAENKKHLNNWKNIKQLNKQHDKQQKNQQKHSTANKINKKHGKKPQKPCFSQPKKVGKPTGSALEPRWDLLGGSGGAWRLDLVPWNWNCWSHVWPMFDYPVSKKYVTNLRYFLWTWRWTKYFSKWKWRWTKYLNELHWIFQLRLAASPSQFPCIVCHSGSSGWFNIFLLPILGDDADIFCHQYISFFAWVVWNAVALGLQTKAPRGVRRLRGYSETVILNVASKQVHRNSCLVTLTALTAFCVSRLRIERTILFPFHNWSALVVLPTSALWRQFIGDPTISDRRSCAVRPRRMGCDSKHIGHRSNVMAVTPRTYSFCGEMVAHISWYRWILKNCCCLGLVHFWRSVESLNMTRLWVNKKKLLIMQVL